MRSEPRQTRRGRNAGAVVALALALALSGAGCGSGGDTPSAAPPVNLDDVAGASGVRGVSLAQPIPKPATALTDTAGTPFDLRTAPATEGSLTLVFFGFTNCPDICPTTMADLDAALDQLSPADREKVSVVFVSTDPERDTGPVIRRWLDQFDDSFIGLTGSWPQIQGFADALGVAVEPAVREPDGSVTVTHSSQVTAFSPDGPARVAYLAGTAVADYVHDLPLLLRGES